MALINYYYLACLVVGKACICMNNALQQAACLFGSMFVSQLQWNRK